MARSLKPVFPMRLYEEAHIGNMMIKTVARETSDVSPSEARLGRHMSHGWFPVRRTNTEPVHSHLMISCTQKLSTRDAVSQAICRIASFSHTSACAIWY